MFYLNIVIIKSNIFIAYHNVRYRMQTCHMRYSSWTYDKRDIDMKAKYDNVVVSELEEDGEWSIDQTKCKRNVFLYNCCPNTVSRLIRLIVILIYIKLIECEYKIYYVSYIIYINRGISSYLLNIWEIKIIKKIENCKYKYILYLNILLIFI